MIQLIGIPLPFLVPIVGMDDITFIVSHIFHAYFSWFILIAIVNCCTRYHGCLEIFFAGMPIRKSRWRIAVKIVL
jgi:hypothetical protein